ncbi:MAG: small basic protein [Phycisphaerae bacterium]|jgi:small basic protein (TIGR04137 family)
MTMDRTLKSHGGLAGSRSVLSRSQRIALLTDEGKFDPTVNSPLGLPKVRVKHSKAGTKTKKTAEEAAAAAGTAVEGAAPVEAEAAKGAPKGQAAGAAKAPAAAKPQAAGAAKGAAKPQAAAKGQEKKK